MTPDSLHVALDQNGRLMEAGAAYFSRRRSTLSTSFRYDESYLRSPEAFPLAPALPLYSGAHQSEGLPGAFADCSPDRWGKNLILKKLQAKALREGRTQPAVSEVDFLTGVSDATRQGALRFRVSRDAPFLAADLTVPKMVELPRLLRAADAVTRGGEDDLAAVKELLDAGSGSLGGARPKASVRDGDRLLIAKFPHRSDEWDVMAWEKVALDLAHRAGLVVPRNELVNIAGRGVLTLDRFDRDGERRVGYISALTLVQGRDGDAFDYTEVAETLQEEGSRTSSDLRQLWRRIAFSIAIHNTDDHLRNHGLLRDGASGWRLSPAFDINPNPNVSEERVTGIGGARGRADELTGLMAYAATFGLTETDARTILAEVNEATRAWRTTAAANGIATSEQHRFEAAFEGLREPMESLSSGAGARASEPPRDARGRYARKRQR